jgi:hypothetical protein
VHNTITTAPIPIPTLTPVDSPLDPVSTALGDGNTASLFAVVDGSWVEAVEGADETANEDEVVVVVAEVVELVSVLGREEARIQK